MWDEIVCKQIYLFKSTKEKQYIVDFGANVGVSVYFLSISFPNAEIHAYEADPEIFSYLKRNVSKFDNGKIHIYNKAVSDHDGTIRFVQEGSDAGHYTNDDHDGIIVECLDARNILGQFDTIDFLKIDIEGSERSVLPAIKDKLEIVSNIFLEYHSEEHKPQCLRNIIECLDGFRLYIYPGYCPVRPMEQADSYFGFDLELNIFGIRNENHMDGT